VHPAYRHLERRPRLAGLTLGQWSGLVAAALGAYALAKLLPFSATYDLSIATTLAGVPVAVSLAAGGSGVNVPAYLIAVVRWRRRAGLHLPGDPIRPPAGYQLTGATEDDVQHAGPAPRPRWDDLWR